MKTYDGCLPNLFRMLVSGSSGTGKSSLIYKILENSNGLMENKFERIIYLQGVETQASKNLKRIYKRNIVFFNDIPPEDTLVPLCKSTKRTVLIIEDLDQKACSSPLIAKFFSVYSHHFDISIILSTQNIFCSGKERLTLVRNATHLILFPNYLDLSVIKMLAQKVHPQDPKKVVDLFNLLTTKKHGYLSIWGNCHPALKFRSNITEKIQTVYTLN